MCVGKLGVVNHSRHNEFKDVVERLLEHHDDGHLDEEVRQTPTGVALEGWVRDKGASDTHWGGTGGQGSVSKVYSSTDT